MADETRLERIRVALENANLVRHAPWASWVDLALRQEDKAMCELETEAAALRAQLAQAREALSEAAEWISEGVPGLRDMGWNNSADLDEKFSAKLRALAAHPETETPEGSGA